jgi:hypothetical protein
MANLFMGLSPEIISHVGGYLDAASLGILRLGSRRMREAFTPHFIRHHIGDSQSIDLTKQGLDRLRGLSSSYDLRPRIRHLHLVCIYYHETPADPDPDTTFPDDPIFPRRDQWLLRPLRLLDAPEDRKWMDDRQAEQFALPGAAICVQLTDAFHAFGGLDQITLEAAVVLGRLPEHRWPPHKVEYLAWRELWARTIQAYRIVMSAIARSQIHLGSLTIYKETKICSVPCNEVAVVFSRILQEGFAAVGSCLNNFSISLATAVTPVVPVSDDEFYEPFDISGGQRLSANDLKVDNKPEFQDIAQLLQLMPNLKSLTMHLYQTFRDDNSFFNSYSSLLSAIFHSTPRPHLLSLDLQGFPVQITLMNDALSNSPNIQSIRLQYMYFQPSHWAQALSPLADTHTPVRSLYLSDIWSFGPEEGLMADVSRGMARNLVAANPESIHLASSGEPGAEINGEVGLWIGLSASAVSGGMASYGDWAGLANRVLECGPPTNYG